MNKLIVFAVLALLLVQFASCSSFLSMFTQEIEKLAQQKNGGNPNDIPYIKYNDIICKFRGPASICEPVDIYGDADPTRPIKTLNDLDLYEIPSNAQWVAVSQQSDRDTFDALLQVNASKSYIQNFRPAPLDPYVVLNQTNSTKVAGTGYYFSKQPADGLFGSFDRYNNAFSQTITQTQTVTITTTTLIQGGVETWADLQELWVLDPTAENPYSSKIVLSAATQLEL